MKQNNNNRKKQIQMNKLIAAGLFLLTTIGAQAYTIESAHWTAPVVPFYVNLGEFNSVAAKDLAVWDQYTGHTRLTTTNNAAVNGNVWFMDGRNSIVFSDSIPNYDLPGNILAVTAFYSLNNQGVNDGVMRETDIIVNTDFDWANGGYDIGRVLLHEIGHAIGLGHSADGSAIMYPYVSPGDTRDVLSADDIAGATFLYGPRTGGDSVPDNGSATALMGMALAGLVWFNRKRQ